MKKVNFIGIAKADEIEWKRALDCEGKCLPKHANGTLEVYTIGKPIQQKMIKENGIRIALCDEVEPDFNIYDYAIGHSRIEYGDRYLYIPKSINIMKSSETSIRFIAGILNRPYKESFRRNRSFWGGMYQKKLKRMYRVFFWEGMFK